MDMGECPPDEVWDDIPSLRAELGSEETLLVELREHLRACPECRERRAQRHSGANRARRYANLATLVFGLLGTSLVLTVCFRTPVPRGTAKVVAPSPQAVKTLPPTTLTRVVPLRSSPALGE